MTREESTVLLMNISDSIQIAAARLERAANGIQRLFEAKALKKENVMAYQKLQNDLHFLQHQVEACYDISFENETAF